jgi:hypothetical protein
MTQPENIHTVGGRLATFTAVQPAKRRASSTRKRGVANLAWPHDSPDAESVCFMLLNDGSKLTSASSLPKLASTSYPQPLAQTMYGVSCVMLTWMVGSRAMMLLQSTMLINQNVQLP